MLENENLIPQTFEIDKLTNSIENASSGDSFCTEITLLTEKELNKIKKKNGWQFDWNREFQKPEREIYKLTILNNSNIIQGIISLELKRDFVFIHLIESAPFNIGKTKTYLGVPGNLVAFACKISFQRGADGYVSFLSKSKLIEHYEKTLGAVHVGGHKMVITTEKALKLTNKYFKS